MKIVKIVYNNNTSFLLDIAKSINKAFYLESYNTDNYKEKKKAIPIMTRHGTKQLPLVVIENENLEEIDAIWSESTPDWKNEIIKKLNE
jgi:hypothetical protein